MIGGRSSSLGKSNVRITGRNYVQTQRRLKASIVDSISYTTTSDDFDLGRYWQGRIQDLTIGGAKGEEHLFL
jgi:hypothetical protein